MKHFIKKIFFLASEDDATSSANTNSNDQQHTSQQGLLYYDLAQVQRNKNALSSISSTASQKQKEAPKTVRSTGKWDVLTTRYLTLEAIGRGGTAVVYRAIDQKLNREVALKRFDPQMGPDAEDSQYLKELTIISSLQHPNVVVTHDMGHDSEGHFIIMSLIRGIDGEKYLSQGPLNLADFYEFAFQALAGLEAIHQQGILHLDLKPSNLMISGVDSERIHLQIIDFGSAKQKDHLHNQEPKNRSQSLVGSIHYMSPESINQEVLDERTDIYALGCVFYQALTGKRPFDGDNTIQVMAAHLQNKYTPLLELRPELPTELTSYIEKMLTPKKEQRPLSARELAGIFRKNPSEQSGRQG